MADIDLSAAELESTFRRGLDAFHRGDWDGFRETITPDCEYEEVSTGERFSGADAYLQRVQMWRTAMPDLKGTVDRLVVGDGTIVAELTWRGTQTGPLQTAMGPVDPTGRTIEDRAVMITEAQGGRAVRVRHYTNPLSMMTQLGLITAPQTTTA